MMCWPRRVQNKTTGNIEGVTVVAKKKRILIIDDEPSWTWLLKISLEKTGRFEVKEENVGVHGLQAAHVFKPDLILIDVMMPDIEGGFLASQFKVDDQLKHIPIVFLTATVSKEEIEECSGIINSYPFIAKPASTQEVIENIERYLKAT